MDWEHRIEYERNLNHTYLVYKELKEEDFFELQMLLNNKISGLLPCRMEKTDGVADLYYEITSKHSLVRLYEKQKIQYENLEKLFSSLYNTLLKVEEFLLPLEALALTPEMIFADIEQREFNFCLIPGLEIRDNSLQKLLEFILDRVDYSDEKAVAVAYEWYKKLGEENSSFFQIYENTFLLKGVQQENVKRTDAYSNYENKSADQFEPSFGKEPVMEEEIIQETVEEKQILSTKKRIGVIAMIVGIMVVAGVLFFWMQGNTEQIWKIMLIVLVIITIVGYVYYNKKNEYDLEPDDDLEDFSKEVICETGEYEIDNNQTKNYGQTVLFKNEETCMTRKLEPVSNDLPALSIEVFPYIIGKMEHAVDGIINHNTVSRIHCKIEYERESYYITDLNSTNGTMINSTMIGVNNKMPLNIGDTIQLGQAIYVFK